MQGQNKALYQLHGQNLLQHSINNLRQNLSLNSPIAISCGQHDYRPICTLPQLSDDGTCGPMAGIIAGLRWIKLQGHFTQLAVIPCDAPFTPSHWVKHLQRNLNNQPAVYAFAAGRPHFAHSLWSIDALDALEQAYSNHQYALKIILQQINAAAVNFTAAPESLDFFNINTYEQALKASKNAS
jgi:molybdopterin-guanine dinucleotide biosynthesis protein A